jgi:hypothetical protein
MTSDYIFQNKTSNGDSDIFTGDGRPVTIFPFGVYGGATFTFSIAPDGTNFRALAEATFSADAEPVKINVPAGTKYKGTITNAGGTTNLTVMKKE